MTRPSIWGLTARTMTSASGQGLAVRGDRPNAMALGEDVAPLAPGVRGDERPGLDGAVGHEPGDDRLGHHAGPDDPDPHPSPCHQPSSSDVPPTGTSVPCSARAASISPDGRSRPIEQVDRRAGQAAPRTHLAELDHRPTHAERREPLLVLGADVAGLVDRLGIVAARAARVPRRGSEVPDPARLPCGLEREVRPLEVPQGAVCPHVRRPPILRDDRHGPWPRRRRPRRADGHPSRSAARYASASSPRRIASGRSGKPGRARAGRRRRAPSARDRSVDARATVPARPMPEARASAAGRSSRPAQPAAARSSSTRSSRSHGRSRSSRPKCP